MNQKTTDSKINRQDYVYAVSTMNTKSILEEINLLMFERRELAPYFGNEEISKYDEIIDIYAEELLSRNDLSACKYTAKAH